MAISEPYTNASTSLASDKVVRPFLAPTFDPVDYLNAVLPSWTPMRTVATSTPSASTSAATTSLSELAAQSSTLLSQLSAQLTRLSTTLSKLTDDILRAGGRLAYEVEVLRGDAGTLNEVLTEGLRSDIERFVPGGLEYSTDVIGQARARARSRAASISVGASEMINGGEAGEASEVTNSRRTAPGAEVELQRLRTLTLVRDRLESVIKVFGAAIEWVIPPSEVSMRPSLISVSAPEAGSDDAANREKKGTAYAKKVREEVGDLAGPDGEGAHAALQRIEQLRELAEVWKGTSEDKARLRFVDSLTKIVEDRKRAQARNTSSGYRFRTDSQPTSGTTRR